MLFRRKAKIDQEMLESLAEYIEKMLNVIAAYERTLQKETGTSELSGKAAEGLIAGQGVVHKLRKMATLV